MVQDTSREAYLAILWNVTWRRRQIRYILLTHHHDDHAGFLRSLIEDSEARLIAHEKAAPHLLEGAHHMDMEYLNACTEITLRLYSLFRRHTYPSYRVRDDDILIRGDETQLLEEIGVEGEILCTPGHTDDSITLLMSKGDAFVGDAAMNFLGFCGIRYRPIVYRSIDEAYRSWGRPDHISLPRRSLQGREAEA